MRQLWTSTAGRISLFAIGMSACGHSASVPVTVPRASVPVPAPVNAQAHASQELPATAPDAAPPVPPGGSASTPSTPPAAQPAKAPAGPDPFLITSSGVGRFAAIRYVGDHETLDALSAAIADVPGLSVDFAVMDIGVSVETEEGYYSVKQGEREVLQLMRPWVPSSKPHPKGQLQAHVVDPLFVTTDGVRVGDKVASLHARYKDLQCIARNYRYDFFGVITCKSSGAPSLVFVIDAEDYRGKVTDKGRAIGPASIGAREIVEIVQ